MQTTTAYDPQAAQQATIRTPRDAETAQLAAERAEFYELDLTHLEYIRHLALTGRIAG